VEHKGGNPGEGDQVPKKSKKENPPEKALNPEETRGKD